MLHKLLAEIQAQTDRFWPVLLIPAVQPPKRFFLFAINEPFTSTASKD